MGFGRFGASFLILVFLATAVSAWTDFVENGSFETGDLTSWDRFKASGGHAFADVYTDFATDGNFAARLSVTELILWGYGWVSIRSQQTTVHNDDIVCFDMTRIGQEGFYYLLLCVNENCEKHSLSCSGGGLQNYNGAVNYDPNLSAHCAKVINAPPEGGLIGIKAVGAHCSRTYTATFHIDKVRVVRTPPRIMNILIVSARNLMPLGMR